MKDLQNEAKKKDVHTHIENGYAIIKQYLPATYLSKVKKKLPADFDVTDDTIRNVRRKIQNPLNQVEVFKALIEVALDNKKAQEALSEIQNQ